MATRRMLHNKISRSEQVNNLSSDAALLFTWMISHADDEGRLKGGSASVRATVFPMKELSNDDVEKFLLEIESQDLIYRWKDENGTYIEFPTWNEHQTLQNDRFKPSKIPAYEEHVSKLDTNRFQSDSTLETEVNKTKQNKDQDLKEPNLTEERGSLRGKPLPVVTDTATTLSEHAAKNAWAVLDGDKQELLQSRYLNVARHGVPASTIILAFQAISRDKTCKKKGEEFEKQMNEYLEQHNRPLLDEDI